MPIYGQFFIKEKYIEFVIFNYAWNTSNYQKFCKLALTEHPRVATEFLYQMLKDCNSDSLIKLFIQDIYDILSVNERKSLLKLNKRDQCNWIIRFWRKVDPTPATLANERLIEHYQRLHIARTRYRSPQPRGYDDRGMIYVRYGEPDDTYYSNMGEFTRGNESWIYHRLKDVSFDFIEYGGLYYLVDDLRKAIVAPPNDATHQLRQWTELFLERQDLGIRYQIVAVSLLNKLNNIAQGQSADDIIRYEYIEKNEQLKVELPQQVSNFRLKKKPLAFVTADAVFMQRKRPERPANVFETKFYSGNESSKSSMATTRLELYYALLLKKLNSKMLFDAKRPAKVLLAFAVYNKSNDLLLQKEDSLFLDLSAVFAQKDYLGQLTFFLEPDTYRVALDIQSPQTNQRGMMQMLVAVPEFPQDRLSMSDIELASIVRPASPEDKEKGFIKNNLYVRPYPYRVVVRQQPIFVYF
ncbi:MAG: GWxTD domain-containing protein, partial [candidate division KSB1 bacterium]|nr:GWxTD domain-containing protein [candidate division KSB1 bacterium]